jgi:glucokinase
MAILALDVGGTKVAGALFSHDGTMLQRAEVALESRGGAEVGQLIIDLARRLGMRAPLEAAGVGVPGIYRSRTRTVWAPNIAGWEDYPLLDELQTALGPQVPCTVDSDRSCYIMGEVWQGSARGARDAIFLAVGTGIGAGILTDGRVLRGHQDIAGAIGWLALDRPFRAAYRECGCFEFHASGPGIARAAQARGMTDCTTRDVFRAYAEHDPIAVDVIAQAVSCWGMAVANLVSLFNPEVIVFGGGVFGPATALLDRIREEALRWAQPISIQQVELRPSALGHDAGLYGAARVALDRVTVPLEVHS